jgi:hypothetical protein
LNTLAKKDIEKTKVFFTNSMRRRRNQAVADIERYWRQILKRDLPIEVSLQHVTANVVDEDEVKVLVRLMELNGLREINSRRVIEQPFGTTLHYRVTGMVY